MSGVPGDFIYQIGGFKELVPQFLPDTVVIRPYGEYGLYPGGAYSSLGGGYWVNANSYATDPNSGPMADIVYLVQNDLKLLPTVKRVLIAIYWYTSLDAASGWTTTVGPAIAPEVQNWAWSGTAPPMWKVGTWSRNNAYYLQGTHHVWPTHDDASLVSGIQYLQGQGYQVGILPINALISRNIYAANLGEYQVDRSILNWTDANLTTFLGQYDKFIHHYVDLCVKNSLRPWIFSIGSGMRDLTSRMSNTQHPMVIKELQSLLRYCKAQLPNTLTTYFADIDEYYYSYNVVYNPGSIDPLWTTSELDVIGVNWFAPMALDDSTDIEKLKLNVLRGEGYDYFIPSILWRSTQQLPDRVLSATTNTFKTGAAQTSVNPRTNGCKDIEDWLVFNHYYPSVPGTLSGCTPPPSICINGMRSCSAIHGNAAIVTEETPVTPTVGGIAPGITLHEAYLEFSPSDYCTFSLPSTIPDGSTLAFAIDFALNSLTSDPTEKYRLIDTAFGLKVDVLNEVVTLQLPQSDGSFLSVQLFTFWSGRIDLVYTPASVAISVDNALDQTVVPGAGLSFTMPQPMHIAWLGNYAIMQPNPPMLPPGYSYWSGRIYYIKLMLGVGDNISGGEFYFEDTYAGIRSAWVAPSPKPWMAITGYGSIHGSGADPFTAPEVITWSGGASIPVGYEDAANLNAAVFWSNFHAVNIRGPYGATFSIDEVYQATMLYSATLGLEPAGPVHIAAWFFDTRSPSARLVKMPANGWQIYSDAYDGEIDASLNGKAAVRSSGINLQYTPQLTVDNMLGLSITPGPLPPVRSIIAEPGVPQQ